MMNRLLQSSNVDEHFCSLTRISHLPFDAALLTIVTSPPFKCWCECVCTNFDVCGSLPGDGGGWIFFCCSSYTNSLSDCRTQTTLFLRSLCVCVFVLLMDRQTDRQTDRCTVSVCCRKVIRFCFFTFFVMRAEVSEVCFSVSSFGGHFSSACVYDHIQSHTCVVSALVDRCC